MAGGVPFFFVSSGFLLENKILKKKESEGMVLKYNVKKNLRIYLLWILCYLPIALYCYNTNDNPFYKDLFSYLKGVIFVGETPYSWPLWYMLALVVSVTVIYIFRRIGCRLSIIWILGLSLMLIGFLLEKMVNSSNPIIYFLAHGIRYILGNISRNGIFEGLAIVTTGMLIRRYYEMIKFPRIFSLFCLFLSFLLTYFKLPFSSFFSGVGWFLLGNSFSFNDSQIYKETRVNSMFVYFIHMYIVFIFMKLGAQFLLNHSMYLSWIIIFIIALILAVCLNRLRLMKGFAWINKFIE